MTDVPTPDKDGKKWQKKIADRIAFANRKDNGNG